MPSFDDETIAQNHENKKNYRRSAANYRVGFELDFID
jgi:hypothetical protein